MPGPHPRIYAVVLLLIAWTALLLLARLLAVRSRWPTAVWAAAGYLSLLHAICLYGLLTSYLFGNALPQLTVFTFPFSIIVGDTHMNEGFGSLPDLTANYVRYVLCFGGLNALLIASFFSLVTSARAPGRTQSKTR
jgi:hypothetical protein